MNHRSMALLIGVGVSAGVAQPVYRVQAGVGAADTARAGSGAAAGSTEFEAPDRSFVTRVPAGWKGRVLPGTQSTIVFEPDGGGDERILVSSGVATANSIQELSQQAIALVGQTFPGLRPAGAPSFTQVGGAPAAEISYRGMSAGGIEVSGWHGMLLKDRFFFGVLSLAGSAKSSAVEQAARVIYLAMRPGSVPENTQMARAIIGRWTFFQGGSSGGGSNRSSSSVSRQVTFYANGRFDYVGAVMVDTSLPGGGGGGASGDTRYSGAYKIYGNTLYAQLDQGGQSVFTVELVQGGGLKISGDLYIKE